MFIFSGACPGVGSGVQVPGQSPGYTLKLAGIGIILGYWYTYIKFWINKIQQ